MTLHPSPQAVPLPPATSLAGNIFLQEDESLTASIMPHPPPVQTTDPFINLQISAPTAPPFNAMPAP
eukprot:4100168-Ditylum_brightwellii.AAC.1